MSFELSRTEQNRYLEIARKAAAQVSRDDQVIGEAADVAVAKLQENLDHVSTGEKQRRAWVAVVARNHARRVGAKLHRELAMGRAGSLPPPMHDEKEDERVEFLIAEMRSPAGAASLGSFVAAKVDFDAAWALIAGEDRVLLHQKYVRGLTSKQIAEERRESPGTIDNKLTAAKKAARLVFEDLLGLVDELDMER
jgi:DNA-directed RNA polymerase specialized sigma24 family protein